MLKAGDIPQHGVDEVRPRSGGDWAVVPNYSGFPISEDWLIVYEYRRPLNHPEFSEDFQRGLRIEWANDQFPLMVWCEPLSDWKPWKLTTLWDATRIYKRRPVVKTQEELDEEAAAHWRATAQCMSYEQAFFAGCAHARSQS